MNHSSYSPVLSTAKTRKQTIECYETLLQLETPETPVLFYYPELVAAVAEENPGFKNSLFKHFGEDEAERFLQNPEVRLSSEPTPVEQKNQTALTRELFSNSVDELILMARATYSATGQVCAPEDVTTRLVLASMLTKSNEHTEIQSMIVEKLKHDDSPEGLKGIPEYVINQMSEPPGVAERESLKTLKNIHFTPDGKINLVKTSTSSLYGLLSQAFYFDLVSNLASNDKVFKKILRRFNENKAVFGSFALLFAAYKAADAIPALEGDGFKTTLGVIVVASPVFRKGIKNLLNIRQNSKAQTIKRKGMDEQAKLARTSVRIKRAFKEQNVSDRAR